MGTLVICTGNICRSPMAAAVMAQRWQGLPELLPVESAGMLTEGYPADPSACAAVADLGFDITAHWSRRLSPELIGQASLLVGMERRHIREAVVLVPESFHRAFTLRELVRRARSVGKRAPGQGLEGWLAMLSDGRTHADLLGASAEDDVDDPMGCSRSVFRSLTAELDELVTAFASLAHPGAGS